MKIGILGTRGIPNQYGGFEQFAEYLSLGLTRKGHEIFVYNSSCHSYQQPSWNGVNLIHCYDPEDRVGTAGQFIYDLNCILDSRKRNFDVILQLGYTSSSIWSALLPNKALIVTNMDGLEWKRSKYSSKVQTFLRWAEKRAVVSSDFLISDSKGIQSYLKDKYKVDSQYIPYGAHVLTETKPSVVLDFGQIPGQYDMLIARMEPENNIEMILEGICAASNAKPFLVVGKTDNSFGQKMKNKFQHKQIHFVGGIYDINLLNNLRYFSRYYFHGHSVGGTNPSLLEAMASGALVCAHRNSFNQAILGEEALYFQSAQEVTEILESALSDEVNTAWRSINQSKVEKTYNWDLIVNQYEEVLLKLLNVK